MDTYLLIPSPAFRQMAPKTRAEIQRAYRERKRERGVVKKTKKPRSEIQRAYRERKQQENEEKFLQQERD